MMKVIDGVNVSWFGLEDFTDEEARKYIRYVLENAHCDGELENLVLKMCNDGKVDVNYQFRGRGFERIRRITGYLTGNLNTWNNAKRAEEKERVKHSTQKFCGDC